MTKLSRRDFIKISAIGMGSLTMGQFLAACAQVLSTPPSPTINPIYPAPLTDTPFSPAINTLEASAVPPTETATPLRIPDLVVARGGEPEALVRQALAAIGGLEQFVPRGANVIVKPNICWPYPYQNAATTNPWVVGTLVKMSFEAGAASVRVMDYPFSDLSIKDVYTISGIKDQVEAAGGEMVYMPPHFKFVKTLIPNGIDLKQTEVYGDILKADVLINVPIAKTHSSTKLTLGMKNLMGVIWDRPMMHGNLGQRIADLTSLIQPRLTVMDAVRILVGGGPTGGGDLNNVKKMNTVIVSPDIVAVDSYATSLFGLQPSDIKYISAGAAMGLGRMDLNNLMIKEITVGT